MSLFDFQEEIHISKRSLYVVLCINQDPEYGVESPINEMIEQINRDLKQELCEYEDISIAYVYESAGMTEAVPFFSFTKKTECRYMNLPAKDAAHNLNHLFFLSMVMLEKEQKKHQTADCRLYLLTNEKFPRVNQIVWQESEKIEVNPRFRDVPIEIVLYKSSEAGGDLLEKYIRSRSGSRVVEVHKTGFVER